MNSQRIISLCIALVVVGVVGWKYYEYKHPEIAQQVKTEQAKAESYLGREQSSTSTSSSSSSTSTSTPASKSIYIETETPINGTKYGVIEVGASGFNSFVVNIDKSKNWELISKEFGESLAYEGFMTSQDVQLGLKTYLSNIFRKGVAGRNVHFVVSSGALKNPKTTIIIDGIAKMGYVVNKVTANQEGKFALRAAQPKAYRDNSFVVDMGSGNTKVSWYEGTNLKSVELPGAKYYQNGKTDDEVYKEIWDATSKVPASKREYCFIIGGVPYELAKQVKAGDERHTQLSNPEEYSSGDDIKVKSGLNIYNAIYSASGCTQFVFDWDANFTIGFLMTLN